MKPIFTSDLKKVGIIIFSLLVAALNLPAVTVAFTQSTYSVRPGDSLDIVVSLDEAVPNGLEGYAIKLEFLSNVLSVNQIDIVPELDFDLFDPGAYRDVGSDYVSIAGFVEIGQPAYSGTEFIIINVTISEAAQVGQSLLDLSPLIEGAINFVDGLWNPLDEIITFGTATLDVLPPWPIQFIDDLRIDLEQGSTVIRFSGTPSRSYSIFYSSDLLQGSWQILEIVSPDQDGLVEFIDADQAARRFYTVSSP